MVVQAPPHHPEPQPQGGGPLPKFSGLWPIPLDFQAPPVFVIFSLCFIPFLASPADMLHISVLILFT